MTVVGLGVGVGVGWVHWAGVFVGAAIVALAQRTIWRGIGSGVGVGVVFVGVFEAWLAMNGDVSAFHSMSQVLVVAIAGVMMPAVFGALTRGVR